MSRQASKKKQQEQPQVKYEDPIIPMCKVSTDVIKKLQTQPYPQLNLAPHSTINEALELYYNEYSRLYKQNQSLNDELATILQERNLLADQYNQIKKMKSFDDNIRRRRRYASEIQRNYHCPVHKCNKGYGSEGSLTHHVRLKHPKFFESGDYEIYLETYILPKQQAMKQQSGMCLRAPIVIQEHHNLYGQVNKQQIKDNAQNENNAQNKVQQIQQQAKVEQQNPKIVTSFNNILKTSHIVNGNPQDDYNRYIELERQDDQKSPQEERKQISQGQKPNQ